MGRVRHFKTTRVRVIENVCVRDTGMITVANAITSEKRQTGGDEGRQKGLPGAVSRILMDYRGKYIT